MKKSTLAIAVVAALAVSYPGAAWLTGKRLETKLTKTEKNDTAFSKLKVVSQTYTRGLFTSTQEQTYELAEDFIPGLGERTVDIEQAKSDKSGEGEWPSDDVVAKTHFKPFQFKVINHITHGPVPGIVGFAAGKVETELVIDPKTLAEIKKVFGDKKFLELTTILNYGGGGTLKIASPAFNYKDPNGSTSVAWKGFKGEIGFDEDYKKLQFNVNTPGLDVSDKNDAGNFSMGEFKASGNIDRAFGDFMLYLGKTSASIASVEFKSTAMGGFKATNISLESDSNARKDLIDMGIKIGMASFKAGEAEFSNFHYDYSLKNIHAETLGKLSQEFSAVSKSGVDSREQMAQFQEIWKKYGMSLLKYDPVISLDRLSISGKSGEFKTTAKVKLVGVTEADFNMPQALLQKVEGEVDVNFADALIEEVVNMTQKDPNSRAMALSMAKGSVGAMEGQGYITRKDKTLSSHMEWKQGKATINGKPYPPMMNAAPAPEGEMPVQ